MWKLGYHANCWGGLGGNAVGVTSITQLTYRTFADIERAIAEIGSCGYEGVEVFDGNLLDYEGRYAVLRTACKNAGVKFLATYSGGNFIFDEILEEELAFLGKEQTVAREVHLLLVGFHLREVGVHRGIERQRARQPVLEIDSRVEIAVRRALAHRTRAARAVRFHPQVPAWTQLTKPVNRSGK